MHEDGRLIEQIRKGDLRAFEVLYDKYKGQVYRAGLAITHDPGAAEDILQDCFLRVHANIHRLDGSAPISPWLHRVTVNLAYNFVARRKRSGSSLDLGDLLASPHASPDHLAERSELRDSVQSAIDRLSFGQRVVVILFYLGDFSIEEIAYILDCPLGTVKSRLHYARNKLRTELTDEAQPVFEVHHEFAAA